MMLLSVSLAGCLGRVTTQERAVTPSYTLDFQIGKELSKEHDKTALHKASMICWKSFQATNVQGDIVEQLMTANIGEITERREYLRRIVAVTALLGKQGLPLRGHGEGEESLNQGNFLETMKLLKQFDPFLQTYTAPSNATYLS